MKYLPVILIFACAVPNSIRYEDKEDLSTSTGSVTSDLPHDLETTTSGDVPQDADLLKIDLSFGSEDLPARPERALDILFVVDNYNGGLGGLGSLKQSWPGFMDLLEKNFLDWEVHFMVIDTDSDWGNKLCEVECTQQGSCPSWEDYGCGANLSICDRTLGAGIVTQSGASTPCDVEPGKRFLSFEVGEDVLSQLECLGDVGSHGEGIEQQINALIAAFIPFNTKPGGCNDGFFRNHALLLVVVVSHTDDVNSIGELDSLADSLALFKDPKDVVFLGLLDDSWMKPDGICQIPIFESEQRIEGFLQEFPNVVFGSVCLSSYVEKYDHVFSILESME